MTEFSIRERYIPTSDVSGASEPGAPPIFGASEPFDEPALTVDAPSPPAAEEFPVPSPPDSDGGDRGPDGRFLPGNRLSAGNPLAARANEFRVALYATCSPDDLADVVRGLIEDAKSRKPWAVKLLLERLLGPAIALDVATRIEKLEILLEGKLQ